MAVGLARRSAAVVVYALLFNSGLARQFALFLLILVFLMAHVRCVACCPLPHTRRSTSVADYHTCAWRLTLHVRLPSTLPPSLQVHMKPYGRHYDNVVETGLLMVLTVLCATMLARDALPSDQQEDSKYSFLIITQVRVPDPARLVPCCCPTHVLTHGACGALPCVAVGAAGYDGHSGGGVDGVCVRHDIGAVSAPQSEAGAHAASPGDKAVAHEEALRVRSVHWAAPSAQAHSRRTRTQRF